MQLAHGLRLQKYEWLWMPQNANIMALPERLSTCILPTREACSHLSTGWKNGKVGHGAVKHGLGISAPMSFPASLEPKSAVPIQVGSHSGSASLSAEVLMHRAEWS